MKARAEKLLLGVGILLLPLLIAKPSGAQVADAMLSRNDRNPAGISQSTGNQTEGIAFYTLPKLAPEIMRCSISSDGFGRKLAKMVLTGETRYHETLPWLHRRSAGSPKPPVRPSRMPLPVISTAFASGPWHHAGANPRECHRSRHCLISGRTC